jgi:predicted membrane-bound dolichyl-phosphate-mannose-protein mannosyltransferase
LEIAKRLFSRFWKWEYAWLALIVLGTLVLHFIVVARPAEPLFDEQHYVPDARNIIDVHRTARTEHPPLAKLLMVSGILIFGDNPYGWRIPSIIFGTLGLIFFFLLCRRLDMSRRAANLGTFILATENLYFVHSGIAMLDIFVVSFMLFAFWLYARRSYPVSAVGIALSTLAKFTGVFAMITICIHWLIGRRDKPIQFVASLILAGLSFMLLLAAFDAAIYLRLIDFVTSLRYGLAQTASLTFVTAKHVSMSRPWEWVLNLEIMPYWYGTHYLGLVSFTVWALIIPAVAYMTFRAFKRDRAGLFGVAWFIGTYLVWIPLSLATNRISFIYYFLPTVPAICLGLGMAFDWLIGFWQARRDAAPPAVAPAASPLAEAVPTAAPAMTLTPLAEGPATATPPGTPGATLEALPPPPSLVSVAVVQPRTRRMALRWVAISFVGLFFLLHLATFIIVAPPFNTWPIETWFR